MHKIHGSYLAEGQKQGINFGASWINLRMYIAALYTL